jgi:hypothetical protein
MAETVSGPALFDYKDREMNDTGGFIASEIMGIAEAGGESIGLPGIVKGLQEGVTVKQLAHIVLENAMQEGVYTGPVQNFTDSYMQSRKDGLSVKDAAKQAGRDVLVSMPEDALVGGISAGVPTAPGLAYSNHNANVKDKKVQAIKKAEEKRKMAGMARETMIQNEIEKIKQDSGKPKAEPTEPLSAPTQQGGAQANVGSPEFRRGVQSAFKLDDGTVVETGAIHDKNKVPEGKEIAEVGFTRPDTGEFLTRDEMGELMDVTASEELLDTATEAQKKQHADVLERERLAMSNELEVDAAIARRNLDPGGKLPGMVEPTAENVEKFQKRPRETLAKMEARLAALEALPDDAGVQEVRAHLEGDTRITNKKDAIAQTKKIINDSRQYIADTTLAGQVHSVKAKETPVTENFEIPELTKAKEDFRNTDHEVYDDIEALLRLMMLNWLVPSMSVESDI